MRWLFAVFLALPCIVWANHAVPRGGYVNGQYNGGNTFILMPSGFEHDPDMVDILDIQESLRDQGYDAEPVLNSFSNLTGYSESSTLLTIEQAAGFIQNSSMPVRVLVTYQHGSGQPAVISWEMYSHTDTGRATRDARWTELGVRYEQDVEIVKTRRDESIAFFGIGVTPVFLERQTMRRSAECRTWLQACTTFRAAIDRTRPRAWGLLQAAGRYRTDPLP